MESLKWSYTTVTHSPEIDQDYRNPGVAIDRQMNAMGARGWEALHITHHGNYITVIYKRPVVATAELNEIPDQASQLAIGQLGLCTRAYNCLRRMGIETLGELVAFTADRLSEQKHFGKGALADVRRQLGLLGYKLRGE